MPKITQIEYFRVPPRWLFVKIVDEAGNIGWGEASLEGHTQAVEGCLDAFIERFTGLEANDIEQIWQLGWRGGFYRGGPVFMSALAGIDIALWDLKARRLSVPIYELLGGKVRDKIKVYAWIGGDRPSDVANQAQARKDQGFTAIKMNGTEDLGWLDSPAALDDCVERLKAVKAIGMDAGIDFHGRVHKPMAKQLAKALEPYRPMFIEEPLLSEHINEIKDLSRLVGTPIALGERLHSRWDVRQFLEAGAVDILQPDISHCGGISEIRRIAAFAETYDVAIAPHCPLGPIALAANVQVAATAANFVIQEMSLGIHYNAGSQDLTSYTHNPEVWDVEGGYIKLMKGPGLGIEIDEEQVRRLSKGAVPWKRKRADAERTRVSRACDRCKRKKTRCSGRLPCILCTTSGLSCEFTAAYTRGRPPSVLPEDGMGYTDSGVSIVPVQLKSNRNSTDGAPIHPVQSDMPQLLHVDRVESRVQSSRNSPEPPHKDNPAQLTLSQGLTSSNRTDLQGHFVGPSSGVSFLLRVQKKLHQKVSFSHKSSIFTFGDAPLPKYDPSFFLLPPKADAEILVARYFDFAVATHRFLHRPTVESWLEEFYDNLGVMLQKDGAKERTALLFMVFAHAREHMHDDGNHNGVDTSARYFQAADQQLSSETGEIRLTSVQARLCQCFYLLSRSRVNHCWSLFGTTARLILAIGIHRKRRLETSNGSDLIDFECRKRVFWCAYGLDNYLSAALGRPRTFHDDDIDQELPTCVDDAYITAQSIQLQKSKGQAIMTASVAHNTLSKIISPILRDLYAIRAPSLPDRVNLTAKYSEELSKWRSGLARFLDGDSVDTSLLIPLFQRQRNVLNLAYYHALILVHRPFLLSNFASLNSRNNRLRGAPGSPDMDKNVTECLSAAMNVALIVDELHESKQVFRGFWFTHYFAFCAVVILYIYTIQQRNSPREKYRAYFEAAEKCQRQISSMAGHESLAERYSVVLEELRLEAVKQTETTRDAQNQALRMSSIPQVGQMFPTTVIDGYQATHPGNENSTSDFDLATNMYANGHEAGHGEGQNSTTPSSLMAELTSWGEFDSLVNAGMGGLDFLSMGDQSGMWEGPLDSTFPNNVGI
ncbi:hypothetical protein BKA64DRAFT_691375 [Cadophora sp. MPI-SDFR-AT-0126]|nr:hypothetical protein BKA64DRAFT_691375 [Leotiomycetes sp. MPI-SDFR-AT-0126]